MWIIFGILTLIMTLLNLYMYNAGKNYHIFMVLSLFLMALTLCDQYQMIASWSLAGDWSAIADVATNIIYDAMDICNRFFCGECHTIIIKLS